MTKKATKSRRTSKKKAQEVASRAGNDNKEPVRRFKNPNYQKLRAALSKASVDPAMRGEGQEQPGEDKSSA